MRLGLNFLPSMKKPNSCQWPAASASGAVAEKVTVRRLVISDSLMVCSGGGGDFAPGFMFFSGADRHNPASWPPRGGGAHTSRAPVQEKRAREAPRPRRVT